MKQVGLNVAGRSADERWRYRCQGWHGGHRCRRPGTTQLQTEQDSRGYAMLANSEYWIRPPIEARGMESQKPSSCRKTYEIPFIIRPTPAFVTRARTWRKAFADLVQKALFERIQAVGPDSQIPIAAAPEAQLQACSDRYRAALAAAVDGGCPAKPSTNGAPWCGLFRSTLAHARK